MDLNQLGQWAGSLDKIMAVGAVVLGAVFSPKLWRGIKAAALGFWGFGRGVAAITRMSPMLETLPAILQEHTSDVAELRLRMAERTDTMTQLNLQLAQMMDRVKRIDHQVHPNGGKSLHDMVRDVGAALSEVQSGIHTVSNVLRISWDALGNFAVFYSNPDGGNIYASAVYLKWVNRTEHEMRGWGWINSVHPDDRPRVTAEWDSCVEDQRDFAMRYRLVRNGDYFEVLASASPLIGPDGKVQMWVGVLRKALPEEVDAH